MSHYSVYYFPAKGRAEQIRLVLEAAGVPYDNKYPADWASEKASLPFNQLPALVIKDDAGKEVRTVAQTSAIVRYLASKHGLVHDDEETRFVADSLAESLRDVMDAYIQIAFRTPEAERPDKFADLKAKTIPAFVAAHTKFLQANGNNGYYFGTKLTYVELAVFNMIGALNGALGGDAVTKDNAPALYKVYETVKAHPKVAAYLASPRLHQR